VAAGVQQGAQGVPQLGEAELLLVGLKKKCLGVGHQLAAAVGQQWQPGLGQGEGLPLEVAFAVLAESLAQPPHMVADGDDAKAADTMQQPRMSMHLVCCTADEQQQLQGQLQGQLPRLAAMDATSAVAALLLLGLAPGAASAAAAAEAVVVVAAAAAAEMAADAVIEPAVHAVGEGAACHWISNCRGAVLGLYQS